MAKRYQVPVSRHVPVRAGSGVSALELLPTECGAVRLPVLVRCEYCRLTAARGQWVIVGMILADSPTYHSSRAAQDPNNARAPTRSVLAVYYYLFFLGAWPRTAVRHALIPMFRSNRLC